MNTSNEDGFSVDSKIIPINDICQIIALVSSYFENYYLLKFSIYIYSLETLEDNDL